MIFSNYRTISLLSLFSKILERLMCNRLLEFLNKHNILNKYQLGFRNMHSTFMALITLLENLRNALDRGNCAIGIFLDFQKAFDTVNHKILLGKLNCYGIRGIAFDWFSSYLRSRNQTVISNEQESEMKETLCGVPQGSILVHYYFWFTSMIYHWYLNCSCLYCSQMTLIFSAMDLIWMTS